MNPREFHTLAESLASRSTAAEARTAVSRAYYAAFNVALEVLRGLGFPISRGAAAHGEIYKCLSNSGDPEIAGVASELNDLHSSRNRADYQMDRRDVEQPVIASKLVEAAGILIRKMDHAFASPRRAQLQASIAKWRRDNRYP